jgi:hypothetical protein
VDPHELALTMLDEACAVGQSARRIVDGLDVLDLRRLIRAEARRRGVRIRTGIVDDVVVAVLADADLWTQPAAVMRERLRPPA